MGNASDLSITSMIAEQEKALSDVRSRIASFDGVLLGQGYVVTSHGLGVGFDIDGVKVTRPHPVGFDDVPMFSREDAERLAAACTDGAGEPLKSMHIMDFLHGIEQAITASLEQFRKYAAQ